MGYKSDDTWARKAKAPDSVLKLNTWIGLKAQAEILRARDEVRNKRNSGRIFW